jgi:AraC-like DNA-binding protein
MAEIHRNTLHQRPGFSLYSGTLPDTDLHAHAAVTLIVAPNSPIRVEIETGGTIRTRSVLLDAGVRHRLVTLGSPVHVCFLEHHEPTTQRLRSHFLATQPVAVDLVPPTRTVAPTSQLLAAGDWQNLLGGRWQYAEPRTEERLLVALRAAEAMAWAHPPAIATDRDRPGPRGELVSVLARRAGLSASRLRHLFRDQFGVSPEHYRLWLQARGFLRGWRPTASMTSQALDHGYFDSAHFSRTWRRLVGITPSAILAGLDPACGHRATPLP